MALYIYDAKGLARNDLIFIFMRANLHEKAQWAMKKAMHRIPPPNADSALC
jgi:hypothetical protein